MNQVGKTILKNGTKWTNHKKTKRQKKRIKLEVKDMFRKVVGVTMTQMASADRYAQVSVKEGIKRYGHKAIEAIMTEYAQLDDRTIFDPMHTSKLSLKECKDALNLITMVKEKQCSKIKGRVCAVSRKQRQYIAKEDVTSQLR
jgi:hypothetical protein